MPKKLRVVSTRLENPDEKKLREWFEAQALESPKTIEEAARLLMSLITGLLGALFAVLTVSAETLPKYLSNPWVKGAGVAAVALWLLSLLCGLVVVIPRKWQAHPGEPDRQSQTFLDMLKYKSGWLTVSVATFGLAVVALGIVLVIALLSV